MNKKKIIFISNLAKNLILFQSELMLEYVARGWVVIACAPEDQEFKSVAKTLIEKGITLVAVKLNRVEKNLFSDFNYTFELFRLIKKERPDVVFSYMIKPIIYGSFAAKLAGVKKIYSEVCGLGYVFINNDWKTKIFRYIVKKLYFFAFKWNQRVIFLNPDDLNLFVNNRILGKNKTVLVNGTGVDVNYYSEKLLLKNNEFLFVGRLIKDKGINEYIEAARIIRNKYPQVRFKLVGGCDLNPTAITEEKLQSIISEGVIDYLGVLEDVRSALESCSVLVLPSYREGIPRSVLEAMATGRPIITTDAPGCRETVADGVNGFLVPVRNVEKLVAAMEKFILNPDLVSHMGKESRRIAEEKYDIHKVNGVILEVMNI